MNSETHFCLRVDVDTYEGLKKGIPKTLEICKNYDMPVTIYLSLGKYETGRNLFRKIQKKESFVTKIPPWKRNSFKSLFRGILLPSKKISDKEQLYLQEIAQKDHVDIQPHGYNHVRWSSNFESSNETDTRKIISSLVDEYTNIFNKKPLGNAAPNFTTNNYYFQILVEKDFGYSSDFKYSLPFKLKLNDKMKLIQLPVTEPTIEDLIYQNKSTEKILQEFKSRFRTHIENEMKYICFYYHAIFEPFKFESTLNEILSYVNKFDFKLVTHPEFMQKHTQLPVIDIVSLQELGGKK